MSSRMFVLFAACAAVASVEAYSGLAENLKYRAVTFTDSDGHENCFVLGSPSDYSANWWDHKKECVYDGYTWYTPSTNETNQGYFECNNDEAWAGYQISSPMIVTRIRFWAGKDSGWSGRVGRSRGVQLQGANTADFSDAVTFYTIVEDDDTLNAGPVEITVGEEFLNRTFTYVRMLAPAGQYCGNVAEVEFYGVESIVKGLAGTVTASDAADGHPASLAGDRDQSTYFKSAEDNGWWGLDLGAVKRVGGFRFIPEPGQAWRCAGGRVQYATAADFSDAVTIVTRNWDNPTDKVATTMTFDAVSARYVRFLANGRACSLAEAEFFAPYETPTETPAIAAAASEGEAGAVTVSWTEPVNACSKIAFSRATAPGGPYAEAGEVDASVGSWNDPAARGGILYYYKAKFVDVDAAGVRYTGDETAAYVSAKGNMQLDRDATGALRDARTPIWYEYSWGNNASTTAAALFDGSVTTYCDIDTSASGNDKLPAAGIDLGTACVISSFSVYPRAELVGRLNHVALWGYNGASDTTGYTWWQAANRTQLTSHLETSSESEYTWYSMAANKTTDAVQCVYLLNDWGNYYANAAELKIYGYEVADVEGVLLAPIDAECKWHNGNVDLSWSACQNAVSYRIERREIKLGADGNPAEDAEWSDWSTIAEGVTAVTYKDSTTRSSYTYAYRLTSVNGDEIAISDVYAPTGERGRRGLVLFIR